MDIHPACNPLTSPRHALLISYVAIVLLAPWTPRLKLGWWCARRRHVHPLHEDAALGDQPALRIALAFVAVLHAGDDFVELVARCPFVVGDAVAPHHRF